MSPRCNVRQNAALFHPEHQLPQRHDARCLQEVDLANEGGGVPGTKAKPCNNLVGCSTLHEHGAKGQRGALVADEREWWENREWEAEAGGGGRRA